MISSLRGEVIFTGENFIILEDVSGVGRKVYLPLEFLKEISLNDKNKGWFLWCHFHKREDIDELYGFQNYAEMEFFESLIKISGVGPKSALAILNIAPVDVLKNAIASGETEYLTKVSGIGRKIAEKVVLELKDKMGAKGGVEFQFKEDEDVFEALKSLGYNPSKIRESLNKIPKELTGVENRVKEALKILGS